MKLKQLTKLSTQHQINEQLCKNEKLKNIRLAIINMDTLFKGYCSFTMKIYFWQKHLRVFEYGKQRVIEVTYSLSDIVKMRYEIKLKQKSPHLNYLVKAIYASKVIHGEHAPIKMSYNDLRLFFRNSIALSAVSDL
jgi:hypothetical protein